MRRFGIHYFFLFALSAVYWPYFPLFLKARGFSLDQIGLLNGCM